jgi:hypothetical protein
MSSWPISFKRIAIAAGIVVSVFLVMDFNSRLENLNRLNKQATAVRAEATQVMQTQVALQTKVAYAGSDQAVEDWARGLGHYIQPGDHPVVPVAEPGSTSAAALESSLAETPLPNWQVWWELFFGD